MNEKLIYTFSVDGESAWRHSVQLVDPLDNTEDIFRRDLRRHSLHVTPVGRIDRQL